MLDGKHNSKDWKIFSAIFDIIIHLKKVFLVILALRRTNGILLFLISKIKFGQISESTNIIKCGDQHSRNFFTRSNLSIGKNLCIMFFSLDNSFLINWAELRVTVVTIKSNSFFSFSFLINKITLLSSPILAAWNQINFF